MNLADILGPLQRPLVTIMGTPVSRTEVLGIRFRAEFTRTGRRYTEFTGPHRTRLDAAVAAFDDLLATGWHFTAPLTEHR